MITQRTEYKPEVAALDMNLNALVKIVSFSFCRVAHKSSYRYDCSNTCSTSLVKPVPLMRDRPTFDDSFYTDAGTATIIMSHRASTMTINSPYNLHFHCRKRLEIGGPSSVFVYIMTLSHTLYVW